MNEMQHTKKVAVTPPGAKVDAAGVTTATIDMLGWDYCVIDVFLGDTDIAMAALKVQESDDSGMSGAADIVGTRIGTDADAYGGATALPTAGNDNTITTFEIDQRGRKRYLDVVATAGDGSAGTYIAIIATLSRAKVSPQSNTDRGALYVMRAV